MRIESEMELIEALSLHFPKSSKNTLRKMLTAGRVTVDEVVLHKAKTMIKPGSILKVIEKETAVKLNPQSQIREKPLRIKILFEDDHIIVVNKQAGLLSVSTDKLEPDTLHSRVVEYLQKRNKKSWAFIVHRLDRETSGVMIFAKHKQHKEYLQEQFSNRSVHRNYHALVEGKPEESSGTIREWLLEDKFLNIRSVSKNNPKSKLAITHWTIEDSDDIASLISLSIETGRRHQIRVGLANIGHPVIGDNLHGASGNPIGRIALHASSIEFLHPQTDDPVRFEAPLPFGP